MFGKEIFIVERTAEMTSMSHIPQTVGIVEDATLSKAFRESVNICSVVCCFHATNLMLLLINIVEIGLGQSLIA